MTCGLDGVRCLEGILAEQVGKVHKVALDEFRTVGNGRVTGTDFVSTVDLVRVQRHTDDRFAVQEPADVTHRSADATTDIQDLAMVTGYVQLSGKLVLVTAGTFPE